jgi:hypothetical protein
MIIGSAGLSISMMLISVLLSFRLREQYGGPPDAPTALGKACASASVAFFFTYMLIFGS